MPASNAWAAKAREAALKVLIRVERDGAYLNLAFPKLLKTLSAGDRALAVRLAKGTIQRQNTLDWALNLYSRHPVDTLTPSIRNLMRLGAYQALYMEKIPHYALVDQSVILARRYGHPGVAGLVNAVLRRLLENKDRLPWPDPAGKPLEYISLTQSHPQWLVKRALERFGFEEAERWCRANNETPALAIRPNLLRTTIVDLVNVLAGEGFTVEESPYVPGVLRVTGAGSPAAAPAFRQGLFTIQGESSALVAPLLGVRPGDTVLDLCSAPGGKATHLAELAGDRGRIYAVEVHPHRLQLVEKAARRLGLKSIQPVQADGREIERSPLPVPDAVLVDAPCSGLGVIRRLPEIKWRRKESELSGFQALQLELLQGAARILRPGGKLLYSVCSSEPEETSRVVEAFNRLDDRFKLQPLQPLLPRRLAGELKQGAGSDPAFIFPHRHGLDGFFMAIWIKKTEQRC